MYEMSPFAVVVSLQCAFQPVAISRDAANGWAWYLDSLGARDDPSWPIGSPWDGNGRTESDATGKASSGRHLTSLPLVVEPQSTSWKPTLSSKRLPC